MLGVGQILVIVFVSLLLLATVVAAVLYYVKFRPKQIRKHQQENQTLHGLYAQVRVATQKPMDFREPFKKRCVVDGVKLELGDRILVKSQLQSQENGIYVFRKNKLLQRAKDLRENKQIVIGSRVFVEEGAVSGQTTFILEVIPSNGYSFQDISQGLVFVRLFDEIFGRNLDNGKVLVTNEQKPTGVEWKDMQDLWPSGFIRNMETLQIAQFESIIHVLTFPSNEGNFSRHVLTLTGDGWSRVYTVVVHLNNGIWVREEDRFGNTPKETLEVLTTQMDQDWFRPQAKRGCVLRINNETEQTWEIGVSLQ